MAKPLTPYVRCRIAMERLGAIIGTLEPRSCAWHAAMEALDELEDLANDLEPKE